MDSQKKPAPASLILNPQRLERAYPQSCAARFVADVINEFRQPKRSAHALPQNLFRSLGAKGHLSAASIQIVVRPLDLDGERPCLPDAHSLRSFVGRVFVGLTSDQTASRSAAARRIKIAALACTFALGDAESRFPARTRNSFDDQHHPHLTGIFQASEAGALLRSDGVGRVDGLHHPLLAIDSQRVFPAPTTSAFRRARQRGELVPDLPSGLLISVFPRAQTCFRTFACGLILRLRDQIQFL